MRKLVVLLLIVSSFVSLHTGCYTPNNEDEEQVLYLFSKIETMETAKRSDGDCTIGFFCKFHVKWNASGCMLTYVNTEEETVQLLVGQKKEIECYAQPFSLKYEVYLTKEGDALPESWKAFEEETERKAQEKKEIGTFTEYQKLRDSEHELSMIRDAFAQVNPNVNADDWYQMFLETTWDHGDVLIQITDAKAENLSNKALSLTLIDSDGNEMVLYGFESGYIDYVKYKGENYAGPFTG